jgi:hypothetical protein
MADDYNDENIDPAQPQGSQPSKGRNLDKLSLTCSDKERSKRKSRRSELKKVRLIQVTL